jgi:hypothetical protein
MRGKKAKALRRAAQRIAAQLALPPDTIGHIGVRLRAGIATATMRRHMGWRAIYNHLKRLP